MLGLGVDADAVREGQPHDLLERRDLRQPVERRVVRPQVGHALLGPQRLQLGQREVLGEPAGDRPAVHGLGGAPAGELGPRGHVGRAGDLVLVPSHQHVVLGGDEVGLDVVGAHRDGGLVRQQRVLGPVGTRAPMADHERGVATALGRGGRSLGGHDGDTTAGEDAGQHAHEQPAHRHARTVAPPGGRRVTAGRTDAVGGTGPRSVEQDRTAEQPRGAARPRCRQRAARRAVRRAVRGRWR